MTNTTTTDTKVTVDCGLGDHRDCDGGIREDAARGDDWITDWCGCACHNVAKAMAEWNVVDKHIVIPTFGPDFTRLVRFDDATQQFVPTAGVRCMTTVHSNGSWRGSRCSKPARTFEPRNMTRGGTEWPVEMYCTIHSPSAKRAKYQAKVQAENDDAQRKAVSRTAIEAELVKRVMAAGDVDAARKVVEDAIRVGLNRGWDQARGR